MGNPEYPYECKRRKVDTEWTPCTQKDKDNLSKAEFHGKWKFRPKDNGTPTANAIVKKVPKEDEKTKSKKTKKDAGK